MENNDLHNMAVKMAAMEQQMTALHTSMNDIKIGLSGLIQLREDLVKFSAHHEQFRAETKTMWNKIDSTRQDLETLKATINNWQGRLQMGAAILSIVGAVGGGIVTWTWVQVQSVPILVERLNSVESRGK